MGTLHHAHDPIGFSAEPAPGSERCKLKIVRAKVARPVQGVMVSREMIGCFTHYFSGRSSPCSGEHCTACEAGNGKRWYSWLAIIDEREHRMVMAELTASAAVELWKERKNLDNLRGFTLLLERSGRKANSPLEARILLRPRKLEGLPIAPDLTSILLKMWEHGARAAETKLATMPPHVVCDSVADQTFACRVV